MVASKWGITVASETFEQKNSLLDQIIKPTKEETLIRDPNLNEIYVWV